MATTKIEWVKNPDGTQGHAWNYFVGCSGKNCAVRVRGKCWAQGIKEWLSSGCDLCKKFVPHIHPEMLYRPLERKKPTTYFWEDCSDWCDEKVNVEWVLQCFGVMKKTPQHLYLSLTKQTELLADFWGKMDGEIFPDNLWFGASVCTRKDIYRIDDLNELAYKLDKPIHRFISFEPLYENMFDDLIAGMEYLHGLSWVIIGAQSNPEKQPELDWVKKIIDVCDSEGIPVFLKDNLAVSHDFLKHYGGVKRQEIPYLNDVKPD